MALGPRQRTPQAWLRAWEVSFGQRWALGSHRVLYGDATDALQTTEFLAGQHWDCLATSPPSLAQQDYMGVQQSLEAPHGQLYGGSHDGDDSP